MPGTGKPVLFAQTAFDLRCEWGAAGVAALAPHSEVVIIVDVLSFTTCVEVAVQRGAQVLAFGWQDAAQAQAFAQERGAVLAGKRGTTAAYSLSPQSLRQVPAGLRLVLPSPNGSTLTLAAAAYEVVVLAGCLRNAAAVAKAAQQLGTKIAVIPAGERWHQREHLRPAFEDWVGAGAILSQLPGTRSPEAQSAVAAFAAAQGQLQTLLAQCGSGQELIEQGFAEDVALAAELNVSTCAPRFSQEGYQ